MSRGISVYDEGLILTGAMRVAHGDVPHRDFYANYGPAQFYILAALFKLFGPSALIERVWDVAARGATTAVVYLMVQRVGSRREAVVASGLISIWLAALGFSGFPIFQVLLCALVGAYCLIPLFERHAARRWLFAAGSAAGFATLFRYDAGAYIVGAEGAVVLWHGLLRPGGLNTRLHGLVLDLATLLCGLAVVCFPVAAVYAASGALADLAFDVLVYPSTLYWRMRSLSFPRPAQLWASPTDLAIYLPVFVWLSSSAIIWRTRRRPPTPRTWLVGLLSLLSALLYIKGLVRVSLIHMALSIVPALLAASLSVPLVRAGRGRAIGWASATLGIVFVVVPTVGEMRVALANLSANLAWARAPTTWAPASANTPQSLGPCHPQAYLGRMACLPLPDPYAAAVRYVASRSRPDERIFVGNGRHDVTFANDNLFYFLAARQPATKWSHYDPGLQTSAKIQREMIAELQEAKPRFVVLVRDFDTPPAEPNDSGRSSEVTLLDDYLRRTYTGVRDFGSTSVLEPRD